MTAPDYTTSPGVLQRQDTSSFDGDPNIENMNKAMVADGQSIEERVYVDTFSFLVDEVFEIPQSGGQKIFFRRMNEGKKSAYQKMTNKDIRVQRTTGDAKMSVDPAGERHELIRQSVTGWDLVTRQNGKWVTVPFDPRALKEWLENADPKIVQGLERAIRDANEWMKQEFTVEEYDKQIEDLRQKRDALAEEEAKKSRLS